VELFLLLLVDDLPPQILVFLGDFLGKHRFEVLAVVHLEDGEHTPLDAAEELLGDGLRVWVCRVRSGVSEVLEESERWKGRTLFGKNARCERERDRVCPRAVEVRTAARRDAPELLDDQPDRVVLLRRDRIEVLGDDAVQRVDLVGRDVDLGATHGRRLAELVGVEVRLGVLDIDDCASDSQ